MTIELALQIYIVCGLSFAFVCTRAMLKEIRTGLADRLKNAERQAISQAKLDDLKKDLDDLPENIARNTVCLVFTVAYIVIAVIWPVALVKYIHSRSFQ